MSISSPNLAAALGPSASETPQPLPYPCCWCLVGSREVLPHPIDAGRHRRAPREGFWPENLIAQRVSALHRVPASHEEFLHPMESSLPCCPCCWIVTKSSQNPPLKYLHPIALQQCHDEEKRVMTEGIVFILHRPKLAARRMILIQPGIFQVALCQSQTLY